MNADELPSSDAEKSAEKADWLDLLRSIRRFSGRELWLTVGVVAAASIVEGLGLVMLLPMASILFAESVPGTGISARFADFLAAVGPESIFGQLVLLSAIFLAWMAARGVFLIYRDRRVIRLTNNYVDHLRLRMFASFVHAPWPVVRKMRKSDILNALTVDLKRVAIAIQFLSKVLITATLSGAYLVVGFMINSVIGFTLLGLAVASVAIAVLWSRNSGVLGKSLTRDNRAIMFATTTFLDGLKTAKVYNAETTFIGEYDTVIGRLRKLSAKFVIQQGRLRRSVEMLGAFVSVGLLLAGYAFLGISGAELLVLVVVVARLTPSLLQSLTGFQSVAYAMPAFISSQRWRRMLEAQSETGDVRPVSEAVAAGPGPAEIVLADVSVEIDTPDGPRELLHVDDIRLPPTGLIHLAGESGAGKSTFAELIAGLYLPNKGQVRAGELMLTRENLADWHRRISFAPQEPFLFNGSIRDNLSWPNLHPDDGAIWEALAIAGADDLVRSVPEGLSLHIQDGGSRLSGGERQRLCLARALLRPSDVLIVDEGLAAVEPKLERQILSRLRDLASEKLVICISHSPVIETLADGVVRIGADGRIEKAL